MRVAAVLLVTSCGFQPGVAMDARLADARADAADAPMADSTADARTCPVGFSTLPSAPATSKYLTFAASSYQGAVASCVNLGTHLVVLDTQGEATAVYALIDAVTGAGDTHLYRVVATRDRSADPDVWRGLDGVTPLTFLPWGAGEPTSLAGEDCAGLRPETNNASLIVIGADQCTTNHEFACECE